MSSFYRMIKIRFIVLFWLVFMGTGQASQVSAIAQNSSPKYILENGHVSGLCGDIYKELSARLALKNISLVPPKHLTPIKRILDILLSRENAIYCGASRSEARAKIYGYSRMPLYRVSNILITQKNNPVDPQKLSELHDQNSLVGTFFGTGSATYLKSVRNLRINDGFKTLERGIQSLKIGTIDYFFYHDLGLLYQLKSAAHGLRAVPTKFRAYDHWMLYSPLMEPTLRRQIDDALAEMIFDGVIEAIWDKYRLPFS